MTPIVFYPHAISSFVYGTQANLFQLTNIMDVQPSYNFADLAEYAASQVGPQFTGSHMAAPDIRFMTHQLGTLFSVTIAGDYYIVRRLDENQTYLHYKAGQNLGTRVPDANTSHFQMLADRNAMLVVESWGADDGQLAWARCRLCCVYNASIGSEPLIPTAGVPLVATSTTGFIHTLGPITVNGTALRGVTSLVCDNNVEYDEESSHGEGFPSYCSVKRYRPVYSIRTRQTDYMSVFGTRGTDLSSLFVYLRNKLQSGINEPDIAPFHIRATAAGGTVKARSVQSDNAQCEISIETMNPTQNAAAYALAANQAIV